MATANDVDDDDVPPDSIRCGSKNAKDGKAISINSNNFNPIIKHTKLDSTGNIMAVVQAMALGLFAAVAVVELPKTVPTVRTVIIPMVQKTAANPVAKARVGRNVR